MRRLSERELPWWWISAAGSIGDGERIQICNSSIMLTRIHYKFVIMCNLKQIKFKCVITFFLNSRFFIGAGPLTSKKKTKQYSIKEIVYQNSFLATFLQ